MVCRHNVINSFGNKMGWCCILHYFNTPSFNKLFIFSKSLQRYYQFKRKSVTFIHCAVHRYYDFSALTSSKYFHIWFLYHKLFFYEAFKLRYSGRLYMNESTKSNWKFCANSVTILFKCFRTIILLLLCFYTLRLLEYDQVF